MTRAGSTSQSFACRSSTVSLIRALHLPSPPVRRRSTSWRRFDAVTGNLHRVPRHPRALIRASQARPSRLLNKSTSTYGRTDVRTPYPPTTVLHPSVRSRVEAGGGASETFLFVGRSETERSGFETEGGRVGERLGFDDAKVRRSGRRRPRCRAASRDWCRRTRA